MTAAEPRTLRRQVVDAVLVIAAVWLVGIYFFYLNAVPDYRADQAHDSFVYLSLAQGLLAGQGYPTKHWQPGFPLYLSGLVAMGGLSFWWLKLAMATLGLCTAAFAYRLFRNLGVGSAAIVLAAMLAATPLYYDFSHRVMSEVLFVTCSVLALAALTEVPLADSPRAIRIAGAVLAIAASAAVLTRGNGLAIPVALGAAWWSMPHTETAKRRVVIVALAASVATFVAWTAWGASREFAAIDNVTYLEEVQVDDGHIGALWAAGGFAPNVPKVSLRGFLTRCYRNVVWHQLYNAVGVFWPGASRLSELSALKVGTIVAALLFMPAVLGIGVLAQRSPPLVAYLLVSLGLIIVYPSGGSRRMLLPAIPALLPAFYFGLRRLANDTAVRTLATAMLVGNAAICTVEASRQARRPYFGESTREVIDVIQQDLSGVTPRDALIISDYYLVVHALTGRRSISPSEISKRAFKTGDVVYVLEARAKRVRIPAGTVRDVRVARAGVELSRLARQQSGH